LGKPTKAASVRLVIATVQEFGELLAGAAPGAAIFLFGAIVNQAWNRYRSRLKPFSWSAGSQKLATATQHPSFGKLEVLHNGQPVNNVYSGQITVENLSESDFANLILKIAYQEGTEILGASAMLEESLGELSLSDEFAKVLENKDAIVLSRAVANREYKIPVFNRHRRVNIFVVLKRNDDKVPIASVACDSVGVSLRFMGQQNLIFRERC
jgi:hypothetical protein